ncbi:hypothetical protein R5R35_004982 [Gryllus longicercus]|uniref:Uncharacterized protein n=1 Tax=Gryllus longicercus TaxID=2509291 RepID=A0AAN9Z5H4_9ORTH
MLYTPGPASRDILKAWKSNPREPAHFAIPNFRRSPGRWAFPLWAALLPRAPGAAPAGAAAAAETGGAGRGGARGNRSRASGGSGSGARPRHGGSGRRRPAPLRSAPLCLPRSQGGAGSGRAGPGRADPQHRLPPPPPPPPPPLRTNKLFALRRQRH